jgi:hypothetical protein
MGRPCSVRVGKSKCKTNFGWQIIRKEEDVDRRMILKWLLKKLNVKVWCGFNWVMIRFSGGLLWTQ